MMSEPKFFWVRNKHKKPLACVATIQVGESTVFALSIHNPADKFDKQLGKKVALGRAYVPGSRFTGVLNGSEDVQRRIFQYIVDQASDSVIFAREYIISNRVVKAVKHWLKQPVPEKRSQVAIEVSDVDANLSNLQSSATESQSARQVGL